MRGPGVQATLALAAVVGLTGALSVAHPVASRAQPDDLAALTTATGCTSTRGSTGRSPPSARGRTAPSRPGRTTERDGSGVREGRGDAPNP